MTQEFKAQLYKSVSDKLEEFHKDDSTNMPLNIAKSAAKAAILVLEEYEKLKNK